MTHSTPAPVVTSETLGAITRATLNGERKVIRNYDGMRAHFGLTPETPSADVTSAAHAAILAAYPTTDPSRLVGKNKNDDQRWKDARAVRVGLVAAIRRAFEADDKDPQPVNLLTRAGLAADLADVIAAWEAAQS